MTHARTYTCTYICTCTYMYVPHAHTYHMHIRTTCTYVPHAHTYVHAHTYCTLQEYFFVPYGFTDVNDDHELQKGDEVSFYMATNKRYVHIWTCTCVRIYMYIRAHNSSPSPDNIQTKLSNVRIKYPIPVKF